MKGLSLTQARVVDKMKQGYKLYTSEGTYWIAFLKLDDDKISMRRDTATALFDKGLLVSIPNEELHHYFGYKLK